MDEDRNMELSAMIDDTSAFDWVHLSLMINVRHIQSPDEERSGFFIILIFTVLHFFPMKCSYEDVHIFYHDFQTKRFLNATS